jgi:hypothetical protein
MKPPISLIYWLPRILCILAILFVSMFALDAFAPGLTLWQQLGDFFIHLIPSFVLLAVLIVAWKWELFGGIIFTIIGLGMSPIIFLGNQNRNHFSVGASLGIVMMITFPFVVIGILFIISYFLKKKKFADSPKI